MRSRRSQSRIKMQEEEQGEEVTRRRLVFTKISLGIKFKPQQIPSRENYQKTHLWHQI